MYLVTYIYMFNFIYTKNTWNMVENFIKLVQAKFCGNGES